MKKNILIIAGVAALVSLGTTVKADEPGTGHTTEVIPGDWDDEEEPTLSFNFQDIPQAKYEGLKLHLSCGLPGAKILYTTDPKATIADNEAWTEYTQPIELTEDCTVRYFGRCEGYNDSDIQSYHFAYADHQAAAPTLAPDIDRKNVVMVSDTPDAIIRYTFDGSEPTEASTAYEGPVTITANGLFRARSFANEMFPSVVTDFTVDFMITETPAAAFENRHLVLACNDEAAKIYYTTSDAAVEDAQAWTAYTGPVALTEDCTVRYFARHEGYHDSEIGSFAFFYTDYQVAAPILEANPEGTHIVMTCETYGSKIHYTTDGSEPTMQSALYSEPVEITSNGMFRARAYADGLFDSNIVDFSVMYLAVPTPTAVFENKKFAISCSDDKATVWYTTDAAATTDDLSAWTEYKAPLELTADCTVRFFGRRTGFNDSDVQTFTFAYADYQVADPTIERDAEGTHLVMETTTADATIHYTADGTEPTENSAVYTEPILLDGNFTYSAIAVAEGMFNSGVNRYVVSNMAVTAPTASFENMKMALACADDKAQIWYTVNPEATVDDIQGWTLYTAPFDMTGDCTLRFFSRRNNYNDSDVQSLTFVYSAYQAQAPSIVRNDQGTHIVMTTAVEGGSIRYTTDSSDPTAQSALYEAPVRIQEGATYRARVFADNMYASEISEYMIGNDKLAVPTATYSNFTLVLSTTDEGASIWYTNDAALTLDNVEAWTPYTEPIALGDDCTYRFFAGDDDANASDVQTFVFQKSDWQVALPTIERDAEGTHLVMATATEGAEIRYTTDGTEPTTESDLYTEPVLIKCNGTFRARAFVKGLYDSEVADFVVANMSTPVAYATFENKLLTLTCSDPEVEIWYTNDDDAVPEEMENWQLYSLPIALTEDCWVHFFTRRENFNDSDIETFVFLRANYTAAAPKIERNDDGREILMSTETEGAEIRYTTDGSDPTEESELYTGPVFITQNCTFRACTFAEGLFESAISEYSVSNMTMMTPHSSFENLLLTLTVWDEAASVWYTLNPDALPENEEEWTLYTEPIALTADCTVRYFARRTGFLDSSIDKFEFVYADYQVAAPVIERTAEGITMTTATENAEIRYTTDGTEPTAESTLYTAPVAIEGNFTLLAKAFAEGLFDSEIAEITVDDQTVTVPTATFANKALTLTADNEATAIWYTTDADATVENTEAWTLYTEPIALTADCTVRFFGHRDGFNDSEIGSFEFVYADYQVAAPVIERTAEGITMTTATENAEIRYTTDGTEPTAESTLYTAPVAIEGNFTLLAKAFAEGLFDSEIAEITVDDQTESVPTATFANKVLTLTADNEATAIWYTTDADATVENTEAWILYTEPIALTADCTVRFFGRRAGFNDSEIGSFEFVYADYQVAAPVFDYDKYENIVAITCETEGAEIRYTTDGSEPTAESALYTDVITVDQDMTIRARAFVEGLFDSEVVECEVAPSTTGIAAVKVEGASIRVSREGANLIIYSDCAVTVPMYDMRGILIRVIDIESGRNVVSGLTRGTYIIGAKKIMM